MTTYEEILDQRIDGYDADYAAIGEHLEFIADIELSPRNYDFDLLRVYVRRRDGMLLWATDSGCSCPSPFEDVRVRDLRESTRATFADTVAAVLAEERPHSSRSWALVHRDIRAALVNAREAGAL